MQVAVLPSQEQIANVGARRFIGILGRNPQAVIGLATGSSPLGIYQALIRAYRAGEVSFRQAQAFCLDEYVGLPADHPEAYQNFIRREFTDQVDFDPQAVHAPAGDSSDPVAAAREYDAQIGAAGPVALQILGIGSDGHIGFNEPGGALTSRTHLGFLTEQTRSDNARFFAGDINQVPVACLTQGLGTIMEAEELLLVATGAGKAQAVRELVEGPVSARWPATVIQAHPRAVILLDEEAASLLSDKDHYRNAWDGFVKYECPDYDWS